MKKSKARRRIEDVRKIFEDEGCVLINDSYTRSSDIAYYIKDGLEYNCKFGTFFKSKNKMRDLKITKEKVNVACDSLKLEILNIPDDLYSASKQYITVRCMRCNKIYTTKISNITMSCRKYGCSDCAPKYVAGNYNRKSIEDAIKLFNDSGYKLLSNEYKNARTKLEYICPNGHKNSMSYDNFKRGYRCPDCSSIRNSKTSNLIENILLDNGIKFIKEYSISNNKRSSCYRFDFYLPEYKTFIEYDGMQHFKPVKMFGGDNGLKSNIIRDNEKNLYCKNGEFKLLRISYTVKLSYIKDIIINFINGNDKIKFIGKEYI